MNRVVSLVVIAWPWPALAWAGDPPTPPPAADTATSATGAPGTQATVVPGTQVPGAPSVASALDARVTALEAQIAELKATSDAALAAASAGDTVKEPMFRIYGFIDMGLYKEWAAADPITPTLATTFVLGNVNLYFDFHPAPDWSSLIEVRLTNYPSGTSSYGIPLLGVPYTATNTTTPDPGNGTGFDSVRWGAIVLERAYIQWQRSAKLGLRVGQFLTPYGIWNVDHGTPTLIALYRPNFEANEMFPEHQLGVELFGELDALPVAHWQLEYHAYVSNGRTPGVVSLTNDKMVGGRLVASTRGPGALAFGLSAMRGRYLDQAVNLDAVTGMTQRDTTVSYEEYAIGLDASLDLGGLRLRGEAALRNRRYETDHRDPSYIPGVFVADGDEADIYALAAYRIADTRFEPYLYGEWYRSPSPIGEDLLTGSVGLNTYFTPAIQIKVQSTMSGYTGNPAPQLEGFDSRSEQVGAKLVMGF